jgi:hypothetical protein
MVTRRPERRQGRPPGHRLVDGRERPTDRQPGRSLGRGHDVRVAVERATVGGMPAEPREVRGGMDAEQAGVVGRDGFADVERVPERVTEAVQHGL